MTHLQKIDQVKKESNEMSSDVCTKYNCVLKYKQAFDTANKLYFWTGFDACLELVINHINSSDLFESNEGKCIGEAFENELLEEIDLYKKDGK